MIAETASHDAVYVAAVTGSLALIGVIVTAWATIGGRRELRDRHEQTERLVRRTYDTVNSVEQEIDHTLDTEPTLGQRVRNMQNELRQFRRSNEDAHRLVIEVLHEHGDRLDRLRDDVDTLKRVDGIPDRPVPPA